MKKMDYRITVNHAFEQVIRNCALPRSYANETWISEEIIKVTVSFLQQVMATVSKFGSRSFGWWFIWGQHWQGLFW